MDGRARLNASAYYYDYNNYQAFSIIGLDTFTQNASAENYGFEVELQASLAEGLDVLLGAGYIDANVSGVPGVNAPAYDSDGNVIGQPFRTGDIRPVQTPKWNLNGLLRYQVPVTELGGDLIFQGDFQYRSGHDFALTGLPASHESGYAVVNGSVAYASTDNPWEIRFAVNNLFNKKYIVQTFDLSGTLASGGFFGMIEQYYGRPRMWSVAVNFEF